MEEKLKKGMTNKYIIEETYSNETRMYNYVVRGESGNVIYTEKSNWMYAREHSPVNKFLRLIFGEPAYNSCDVCTKRQKSLNNGVVRKLLLKFFQLQIKFINFQIQFLLRKNR